MTRTPRPPVRLARPPAEVEAVEASRPSWRIKRVAATLDCDGHTVRDLVRDGQLEAHRIGKRGIRIFADSVREYQERSKLGIRGRPPAPSAPGYTSQSHREARAYLRKLGLRNA